MFQRIKPTRAFVECLFRKVILLYVSAVYVRDMLRLNTPRNRQFACRLMYAWNRMDVIKNIF